MENEKKEIKEEPKKLSMVESAHEVAEKLRLENERMEANIKKVEELKAFETLGGKTEGREQEVTPKEVDPVQYSQDALEGKIEAE